MLGRDPAALRDLGAWKSLHVGLMLTHLVTGPLLTPFVLVILARQVLAGQALDAALDARSPAAILEATLATAVLAMGVVSTLWCGTMGLRRRRVAGGWAALVLMLPYQLLISTAAWCGLWDLVWTPYHWHKTEHGVARSDPAGRKRRKTS